jgi:hypothetical protein
LSPPSGEQTLAVSDHPRPEASVRHGTFLLTGWLALASALAWLPPAAARVGVTSETNGDPMGKPPSADERVLRMGIDIQADELITTHQDDLAHIVFLDGTSLTVAPNARIKVDRFVYDPNTKTGDLSVTVAKGAFRLVGGKISKTNEIKINTPAATIGIRGGIALFDVDDRQTKAQFLFGQSMVVSARGGTQTASRPGSEITTIAGSLPGRPGLIPIGGLGPALGVLEASPGRGRGGNAADDKARRSGFSEQNSGRGITLTPPSGATSNDPSAAANAVSNSTGQRGIALATIGTTGTSAPASGPPVVVPPLPPPPVVVPPPPPPPVVQGGPYGHHHHHHHHFSFDFHGRPPGR